MHGSIRTYSKCEHAQSKELERQKVGFSGEEVEVFDRIYKSIKR
jgi:hypothetical protein